MKSRILFYLTTIFLVLTTALFFLGQLSRVTFQSVPVNLYAYEIGLGAVFCFLVARFGFSPLKKRFAKIVSGFLLYLTLTSIMAAFSFLSRGQLVRVLSNIFSMPTCRICII